jgi:hypothetical protein
MTPTTFHTTDAIASTNPKSRSTSHPTSNHPIPTLTIT